MLILSLIAALGFAAVHLASPRLAFFDTVPRSIWLSAAGGISVAYIFVHLLPEIAAAQAAITRAGGVVAGEVEIFLAMLLGLTAFYGIERMVKASAPGDGGRDRPGTPPAGVFWIHIAFFAAYNVLVGYLLVHREEPGAAPLALFAAAIAVHLLVNDRALALHHGGLYRRRGRFVLAVAALAGWGAGALVRAPELAVTLPMAAIGGATVLNVMKEELPRERESRFSAFLAGVALYTALLLAVG